MMPATTNDSPIVLVLPARNEAAAIGAVCRRVPRSVAGHRVIVVVVDDGSSDGTGVLAAEHGALVVSHPDGRGLGAAVRTGLCAARSLAPAAVAFCDADGEYAPEELHDVVGPILAGSVDYVVGSRFAGTIRHMRAHRRVGNRALTLALRWWTGTPITDAQSGYRALSPAALAAFDIPHDYNYAQVLTCDLLTKGLSYAEVPISYSFRTTGRSFVRIVPYLTTVVPALVRQRRMLNRASDSLRPRPVGSVAPQP